MIHVSNYFTYLAMVWSCYRWIKSKGPLYSDCEIFKRKNLKQLLIKEDKLLTIYNLNSVKTMRKSKKVIVLMSYIAVYFVSCKFRNFALTIPEINTQLHDKSLLHLHYKFDTVDQEIFTLKIIHVNNFLGFFFAVSFNPQTFFNSWQLQYGQAPGEFLALVYYQVSREPGIAGCSRLSDIYLWECGLVCASLFTDHLHIILSFAC